MNNFGNDRANESAKEEVKTVSSKTKKIAKKETTNTVKRKRRRKKHMCRPLIFDLGTKQTLSNPNDQVWRVKFSNDGKYIVAATKDNSLFCWKQK